MNLKLFLLSLTSLALAACAGLPQPRLQGPEQYYSLSTNELVRKFQLDQLAHEPQENLEYYARVFDSFCGRRSESQGEYLSVGTVFLHLGRYAKAYECFDAEVNKYPLSRDLLRILMHQYAPKPDQNRYGGPIKL